MRSPGDLDDADAAVDETLSDDAAQRVLRLVLIVLVTAVVTGLFAGAAIWALGGDDDPPAPMNAVDVGFLQDMLDHHDQALLISNLYLDDQPQGEAAPYADLVARLGPGAPVPIPMAENAARPGDERRTTGHISRILSAPLLLLVTLLALLAEWSSRRLRGQR